jgi:hypothetical protein
MSDTDHELWPDVTSPIARRVLQHIMDRFGTYIDWEFINHIVEVERGHASPPLCELWRKVNRSGLAQSLPGGGSFLPDISSSMTGLAKVVYRFRRPRTLEQQVSHLVQYLEFYSDPHAKRSGYRMVYQLLRDDIITFLVVLLVAFFLTGNLIAWYNPAVLIIAAFCILGAVFSSIGNYFHSMMTLNHNATVTFHYFWEEYSDKPIVQRWRNDD